MKEKIFESAIANLGEHFDEYLIIVRDRRSCLTWASSDTTWARGAADCYLTQKRLEDMVAVEAKFTEGE